MSAYSIIGFIIRGELQEEIFNRFAENPSKADERCFNLTCAGSSISIMAAEELEDDDQFILSVGSYVHATDGGVGYEQLDSAWQEFAKIFDKKGLTAEEIADWGLTKNKLRAISVND